jgi:acyl-CoA synthetase (NDP forming)
VEALGDVVFRVHPVTDIDAAEMVRQVKGYKLLEGLRGEKGIDFTALEETIQRISQLVGDFPQVTEVDINPFIAFEPGKQPVAVDARVVLSREALEGSHTTKLRAAKDA